MRRLVQRVADQNRPNDFGIAGAIFKCENEAVRVLMEAGSDPHWQAGEPNGISNAKMFSRTDLLGMLSVCEGEFEVTLTTVCAIGTLNFFFFGIYLRAPRSTEPHVALSIQFILHFEYIYLREDLSIHGTTPMV